VKKIAFILILLLPTLVSAQHLLSEPVPWQFSEIGQGYQLSIDSSDDTHSEWQTVRFGVTGLRKTSETSRLFFGLHHISFSDGGNSVLNRWPDLIGDDSNFPGESRTTGWSRPYFGLISDNNLPLLGKSKLCVKMGTLFSSARLYPFSSRSISTGFYLYKNWSVISAMEVVAAAGHEMVFDAVGDELFEDAYPSTNSASLNVTLPSLGVGFGWRGVFADGTQSSIAQLGYNIPVGDIGSVNLSVERELSDESVRLFGTRIKLALALFASEQKDKEEELDED